MALKAVDALAMGVIVGLMVIPAIEWGRELAQRAGEYRVLTYPNGRVRIVENANREAWVQSDTTREPKP